MPRIAKFSRSRSIYDASIASSSVLEFLAPAVFEPRHPQSRHFTHKSHTAKTGCSRSLHMSIERLFYNTLIEASLCHEHQRYQPSRHVWPPHSSRKTTNECPSDVTTVTQSLRPSQVSAEQPELDCGNERPNIAGEYRSNQPALEYRNTAKINREETQFDNLRKSRLHSTICSGGLCKQNSIQDILGKFFNEQVVVNEHGHNMARKKVVPSGNEETRRVYLGNDLSLVGCDFYESNSRDSRADSSRYIQQGHTARKQLKKRLWRGMRVNSEKQQARPLSSKVPALAKCYHTSADRPQSKQQRFADASRLPTDFFDDISALSRVLSEQGMENWKPLSSQTQGVSKSRVTKATHNSASHGRESLDDIARNDNIMEQMKLLACIRELEDKLAKAKTDLSKSVSITKAGEHVRTNSESLTSRKPIVLTKEDYMNLVDLYYHSHNSRFSPESTDNSPTPIILDDYSFTLSADFTAGADHNETVNEDENYESPLKKVEELLKQRQLREIAVMQVFVDLLIDDTSSNRALYEAYKQLPEPGVAYLPKGVIRLFLQRMSTPWTLSEKSMLRYLSLIDDMQKAKLPINVAEWSSAVYLAGRAFTKVTTEEVNTSFQIWQNMEREAGVQASNVTFNILFDIAVRSGRFALGETILMEMHSRNLRLNRLGRVSLIYYHGLRKDGDGVRKAYRDFVEAGEIVDTLVMNCVIASLLNAQEPQAAEQVYARMKDMQSQLQRGINERGEGTLYRRYPGPGPDQIDLEMASNRLGRILLHAYRLRDTLPDHHERLQAVMPLTPDHVTFRALLVYHATISGDLDRLTVLLQDMTEIFRLPLQTISFQLLFKGFAIHGPVGGPGGAWTAKRLDLCWNACREAIKASERASRSTPNKHTATESKDDGEDDAPPAGATLPSVTQVNAATGNSTTSAAHPPLSRPPPPRLSGWSDFVLDLAAFPRERLKRLERFHATMFDAENVKQPHEHPGPHTYQSPFFQSEAYTAPEPQLDKEEGEYELPNPSESGLVHGAAGSYGNNLDPVTPVGQLSTTKGGDMIKATHQVGATKTLICWLIRAYARTTKSRAKLEEIWGQVRKVYKPRDSVEMESVLRVLRRCLRDCDREGG